MRQSARNTGGLPVPYVQRATNDVHFQDKRPNTGRKDLREGAKCDSRCWPVGEGLAVSRWGRPVLTDVPVFLRLPVVEEEVSLGVFVNRTPIAALEASGNKVAVADAVLLGQVNALALARPVDIHSERALAVWRLRRRWRPRMRRRRWRECRWRRRRWGQRRWSRRNCKEILVLEMGRAGQERGVAALGMRGAEKHSRFEAVAALVASHALVNVKEGAVPVSRKELFHVDNVVPWLHTADEHGRLECALLAPLVGLGGEEKRACERNSPSSLANPSSFVRSTAILRLTSLQSANCLSRHIFNSTVGQIVYLRKLLMDRRRPLPVEADATCQRTPSGYSVSSSATTTMGMQGVGGGGKSRPMDTVTCTG
eukprot:6173950-Pleurochrysis_carterae.AAC.1